MRGSDATGHGISAAPTGTVMWRRWLKGSLAGALPLLSASDGLAASLRATAASADLLSNLALGGAIFAGAGALAVAALPAVRKVVLPSPVETYLSDLLQFDRCDDGVTIRTKDGALV